MDDGTAYAVVDFSRQSDALKSMIRGLFEMSGLILVVSATSGPLPTTWDVLRLARLVKVPYIFVFINKLDLTDDVECLDLLESEVREMLVRHGWPGDDVPIVRGSALAALNKGTGLPNDPVSASIHQLSKAVRARIRVPTRAKDLPFLLPIEDVFDIKGRGRIVGGRIERGMVRVDDQAEVVGFGAAVFRVQITGVEAYRKVLNQAEAGDNVGCILQGIERVQLKPGQVLATPDSITPSVACTAWVYLCTRHECGTWTPIFSGHTCPLFFWTTDLDDCSLAFVDGRELALPGDLLELRVALGVPVALEPGVRFAIRKGGLTIGFGIVTECEGHAESLRQYTLPGGN
jgi:elongation factor Tu